MLRTIEHDNLRDAQKALLPKIDSGDRGGTAQCEFLEAVKYGELCGIIREWGLTEGEEPAVPRERWTEKQFLEPPWKTEIEIADTWETLTEKQAARAGLWTSIHLAMMEQGRIESHFLAGKSGNTGRNRIMEALESKDSDKIDRRVRDVLRRLGGVTERSARTTYADCPTARAWWRYRYAHEVNKIFPDISVEDLSETLRSKSLWEILIEYMVSKLTVIGDKNIRSSIISFKAKMEKDKDKNESNKKIQTVSGMKSLIESVGRRSVVQALGALEPKQVFQIIEEEIFPNLKVAK